MSDAPPESSLDSSPSFVLTILMVPGTQPYSNMPYLYITTVKFGVLQYVGTVPGLVMYLVRKASPSPFASPEPSASPPPLYSISHPPSVPLFLSIRSTVNTCHFVWVVAPETIITSLLLLTDTMQHGIQYPTLVPLPI